MMRSRRQIESIVVAVFLLCTWYLFDAHFNVAQRGSLETSVDKKPWRHESTERQESKRYPSRKVRMEARKEKHHRPPRPLNIQAHRRKVLLSRHLPHPYLIASL